MKKFIIDILSSPGKRMVAGFLMILVCGPLGAILFPPLIVFVFVGVFLFLGAGEAEKVEWFETEKFEQCDKCNGTFYVRAVKRKHYIYPVFPIPVLIYIFSLIKVRYKTTYYIICSECLKTHIGKDDFSAILSVANGGLATVKEITKDEFKALVKK